jgi:hypothetical protein
MTQATDAKLTGINEGLTELRGAVALVAGKLHLHGEMLGRILEILTPEQVRAGPSLDELLANLIARLDRQAMMLKEILVIQGKLARDLPADLVRAIDDNLGDGGHTKGGAPGGKTHGGSA